MRKDRSENGQALVLIVLSIVAMFGIASLAVDLGLVYSVRRQAQSAADAAALDMAFRSTQPGGDPVQAGLKLLAQNGFGEDTDPNANPEKKQDVQLWNPPISGPYASVPNNQEYFQVIVRTRVNKIFSQFVFAGPQEITVEAVTHLSSADSMSPGLALHAIGRDHCPGIIFNGGSTTTISGGSILSNSNGTGTSGNCASGEMTGTSGSILVTDGQIRLAGSWIANAGGSVSPAVQTNVAPSYPAAPPAPNCAGLPERSDSTEPLLPGRYPAGISFTANGTKHTMKPGLYCLDGNFTVSGGSLTGQGVTIYMTPAGGGVNFSGSAYVMLTTGSEVKDADGKNYGGYLIYMDADNHNGVDMAGSNGSFYQGTIYAPGYRDPNSQKKCNIGGSNTSISLRSNIICYSIGIAGNSSLTILYNPNENARNPARIDLIQ